MMLKIAVNSISKFIFMTTLNALALTVSVSAILPATQASALSGVRTLESVPDGGREFYTGVVVQYVKEVVRKETGLPGRDVSEADAQKILSSIDEINRQLGPDYGCWKTGAPQYLSYYMHVSAQPRHKNPESQMLVRLNSNHALYVSFVVDEQATRDYQWAHDDKRLARRNRFTDDPASSDEQ